MIKKRIKKIESSLFQRLLLSTGKTNKEKVLKLSKQRQILTKPSDILKKPYVFEFLGIKGYKLLLENNL